MHKSHVLPIFLICTTLLSGCEFFEDEPKRNVHFIGIGMSYAGDSTKGTRYKQDGKLYGGDVLAACLKDVKNVYNQFSTRGYDSFSSYSGDASTTYISDENGLVDSYSLCFDAIEEVKNSASSSDLTIFFYSGHGSSAGEMLLTDGTKLTIDGTQYCQGKVLPAETLLEAISSIPGDKLVLMDCCYSGQVEETWAGKSSEGIERFFTDHGDSNIYILTAANASEESWVLQDGSYFALVLVNELESHSSITFSDLYANVKEGTQYPVLYKSTYQYQHTTSNTSLPLDLII